MFSLLISIILVATEVNPNLSCFVLVYKIYLGPCQIIVLPMMNQMILYQSALYKQKPILMQKSHTNHMSLSIFDIRPITLHAKCDPL